ncbi:MAG: DUF3800 domain-containing protein [bacterium]|nr:DUF3800 domain-containing protein [bacterium]
MGRLKVEAIRTMYVYVDESGIFCNPKGRQHTVSCVTSLSVPEAGHGTLLNQFDRLIGKWRKGTNELKGSKLDEQQVSQVVELLRRFDVVLNTCTIDLGLHEDHHVTSHKLDQAAKVTALLSPDHHPNLVRQVRELADRLRALPNQLYLQALLLTELVFSQIRTTTLYFCQTDPAALGAFRWRIDAKSSKQTEYEDVWGLIVMPLLQSRFIRTPGIRLTEGDYTHYERFDAKLDEPPAHLKPYIPESSRNAEFTDIGKIMREDLSFLDSRRELGLQIADILANAIQRSLNERLRRRGWRNIGALMIKDADSKRAFKFLCVSEDIPHRIQSHPPPYASVIAEMEKKARVPITEAFRKARPTNSKPNNLGTI